MFGVPLGARSRIISVNGQNWTTRQNKKQLLFFKLFRFFFLLLGGVFADVVHHRFIANHQRLASADSLLSSYKIWKRLNVFLENGRVGLNYYLNRTAFGGTDSGNQDAGRGGDAGTASHFALERRQFARDALLRLEGVLKVALGFATLSFLATHLLFSFVQLAFESLSNEKDKNVSIKICLRYQETRREKTGFSYLDAAGGFLDLFLVLIGVAALVFQLKKQFLQTFLEFAVVLRLEHPLPNKKNK